MGERRFILRLATALAVLSAFVSPSWAIISDDTGTYINQTVGATTFYNNGFTGTSAVVANIEAGYIWDQHLLLTQDTTEFSDPSVTGQFDLHATAVGSVINGVVPFDGLLFFNNQILPLSYLNGIAPNAQVWSGAVATSWVDPGDGSYADGFNISNASVSTPYLEAMVTGVPSANNQTADVITSSWSTSSDPDGLDYLAIMLDALANQGGKSLVLAAGNSGQNAGTGLTQTDSVFAPASGLNAITVGALQSDETSLIAL